MGDADPNAGQGDGGDPGAASWQDDLPESLRSDATLRRFKSVENLARGYLRRTEEIARRPAADAIVVPGEDATDEQRSAYRNARGIPENAEGYELGPTITADPTRPDKPAVKLNPELVNDFRTVAHELGLTQDQAKRLVQFQTERIQQLNDAATGNVEQILTDGQEALEKEFGADKLEGALAATANVLALMVPAGEDGKPNPAVQERLQNFLKTTHFPEGVGANADFKAFMAYAAMAMGSDRFEPGAGAGEGGGHQPSGGGNQGKGAFEYGGAGKEIPLTES